jgi:glycosyltransferase involved in cell wall biosynthesis
LTSALTRKGLRIRIGSDSPPGLIQKPQVKELWKPDNLLSLLKIPGFVAASRSEFVLFNISFAVFGRSRVTNFIGLIMMSLTSKLGRLLRYRTMVIAHNLPDALNTKLFGLKPNLINRIGFLIAERLLLSCDATVVTLRLYRKMIESRFRRKVDYVPHGTWYSSERKQPASSERNNLLFFGYLSPSKDMNLVAEVFNKLKAKHREIRLRLVASPHPNFPHDFRQLTPFEGVPVITLTRGETKGTTIDCPRCGERLQWPVRGDAMHRRQLWCEKCGRWMDRDLCAVLNISRRGWMRFVQSKGGAGEAVKGNAEHEGEPLILRVDASKLGRRLGE